MIKLFLILQVLDLATTLLGFRLGLEEASPVIRFLIAGVGPVNGVLIAKVAAPLILLGACIGLHRPRVIRWINYWYLALVLWNLSFVLWKLSWIFVNS